jgi:hypothetical protein
MTIVASEQLHRDQVANGRHWQSESRGDLKYFRAVDDLALDTSRSEKKIGHQVVVEIVRQSHGCDSSGLLLLDQCKRGEAVRSESVDKTLSLIVAGNGNGKVGVAGEARFASHRHGKSSDQGKSEPDVSDTLSDSGKRSFESIHVASVRTRPGQSPFGAREQSDHQRLTARWTSASVASG